MLVTTTACTMEYVHDATREAAKETVATSWMKGTSRRNHEIHSMEASFGDCWERAAIYFKTTTIRLATSRMDCGTMTSSKG